jgi:hypothetical protein
MAAMQVAPRIALVVQADQGPVPEHPFNEDLMFLL